jgi:hypothetical protein
MRNSVVEAERTPCEKRVDRLTVTLVLVSLVICLLVFLLTRPADGNPDRELLRVSDAIQILQPITETPRARKLASVFIDAGQETWIDPLLLVAISMRESSLLKSAEDGSYRGALGERGLLQVHGVALQWRPEECQLPLVGAVCQLHTGARVLQYWKTACPGSTYRWVSAYGRGECPSEQQAKAEYGVRKARRYYLSIGGEEWQETTPPRDSPE